MMIWMAMWFALAGPTGESPHAQFVREFEAGADCPRLFDLRNAAKPAIPPDRQVEMNKMLRSVQCFSSSSKRSARSTPEPDGFTVRDYRIYRSVVDAPMSVPEARALQDAAKRNGVTAAEARRATNRVQAVLSQRNWFGTPEAEIRRASDWNGDKR